MLSADRPLEQTSANSFAPLLLEGMTVFRFWAPLHDTILLKVEGSEPLQMQRSGDGWHWLEVTDAGPGALYQFVLPDGLAVPDPASKFQPRDVHGPSEVIDLDGYEWKSEHWAGRPWEEMVIYELHIGSFTQEGTFKAAAARLDYLQQLGITAIQIMPLSDFPGRYNWGYDGVMPYAPDGSYGRPEDLMALVDAAHERGISVFLDVVYNHFGPDGNYMPNYAPLFTDKHKSNWGQGINYDADGSRWVREFVIQNAIYWVKDFRFDGLRLDAVHAIVDTSPEHVLHELARRVKAEAAGRHVHLIVENEENDSDLLKRGKDGKPTLFTAQWNDDIHHVLHIAATGETFGYYADFAEDPDNLGRALAEGFVFQGQEMPYRGKPRGKPSADLPPTAFVSFIQNHDQVGNRALGDRMVTYRNAEELNAIAAVCLLAPQIPMLFMGEEWGAPEPFPYFCDFDEDLNEKVRKGRREELSRLPGFEAEDLLDPTAYETFASAKLDWSRLTMPRNATTLEFYRELLRLRATHILPLIKDLSLHKSSARSGGSYVAVDWTLAGGHGLHLLANLSGKEADASTETGRPDAIFTLGSRSGGTLAPWTVIWSVGRS